MNDDGCVAKLDSPGGGGGSGGSVDAGLGDVNAKTRADAYESAKVLNSAHGVT